MKYYKFAVLFCVAAPVVAYTSTKRRQPLPRKEATISTEVVTDRGKWRAGIDHRVATRQSSITLNAAKNKNRCASPCPEPAEDWLLDRRESLFATLGAVWATVTGPAFMAVGLFPEAAVAEFGADAKIELPNPIKQSIDRAKKQCLVESLGSRECLVYESDAADKLYQGVDSALLLGRLEAAATALATIPSYVEVKQWSKVSGVLTGPMGELIRTMGQLSQSATSEDNVARSALCIKRVKNDLYAISDAVGRKDGAQVLKFHADATNDLVAFIKAL